MPSSVFIEASRLLTGQSNLAAALGDCYEREFNRHAGAAKLLEACSTALSADNPEQSIKNSMTDDAVVAAAARELLHLWFVGAPGPVDGKDQDYLTPDTYFGALLWPTIGAHPPGLSGGYFGHWRYLPDA